MSRKLNLASLPLGYPPALEWLRANNVDPTNALHQQEALIEGGNLTLKVFVRNEYGNKQLKDDEVVTERITVPLISAPENHGL